ncbi:hypothetical protein BC829DRAFT_220260 [Chytridium lagenaria]|nr:hypothetical protein BC829DRAFT_220260 [Chytridium lagenaria]
MYSSCEGHLGLSQRGYWQRSFHRKTRISSTAGLFQVLYQPCMHSQRSRLALSLSCVTPPTTMTVLRRSQSFRHAEDARQMRHPSSFGTVIAGINYLRLSMTLMSKKRMLSGSDGWEIPAVTMVLEKAPVGKKALLALSGGISSKMLSKLLHEYQPGVPKDKKRFPAYVVCHVDKSALEDEPQEDISGLQQWAESLGMTFKNVRWKTYFYRQRRASLNMEAKQ